MTVGTVVSADMHLNDQVQPHAETRFAEVDKAASLRARHERAALLVREREALA